MRTLSRTTSLRSIRRRWRVGVRHSRRVEEKTQVKKAVHDQVVGGASDKGPFA